MTGFCPCGESATDNPADAGTCGAFPCLYRHFCGDLPPDDARHLRPLPWSDPREVGRIAVVRPGQLGDLLLALPGLRALRCGFPAAEITLIAQPWAVDLFGRFDWIDRILPLTGRPGDGDPEAGSTPTAFLAEARSHDYDLVLQLQADVPAFARLALALGGRATAGFCADQEVGANFHLLLSMSPREPELLRVLRLVHVLGIPSAGAQLEFPLLPEDEEELERIPGLEELLRHRPLIALHAGARAPARRWPLASFGELAALLRERYGAALLMVGGPEEAPLGDQLGERLGEHALKLAGKLSLGGLAALLARVDLFVGNDSGPAQLAAATAPRSLRIFGPANRQRWAPLDRARHRIVYRQVECSPCDHFECPIDHRCLEWITVEEVMAELGPLLRAWELAVSGG